MLDVTVAKQKKERIETGENAVCGCIQMDAKPSLFMQV